MSTPNLSHLQGAVLDVIGAGDISGRAVRTELKERKIHKSGPAFYQLMSRLEAAKFVTGRYEEKIVGGQRIRERKYQMTGEGERALNELRSFYSNMHISEGGTAYV